MKKLFILLIIFPIFISSCSDSTANDDEPVINLILKEGVSEKDAKCLVKEVKFLEPKEIWFEYAERIKKGENPKRTMSKDKIMTIMDMWQEAASKCEVSIN